MKYLLTPKALPVAMIILSLLAALAYFVTGDFRRTTYWLAAAVLTSTVTF